MWEDEECVCEVDSFVDWDVVFVDFGIVNFMNLFGLVLVSNVMFV